MFYFNRISKPYQLVKNILINIEDGFIDKFTIKSDTFFPSINIKNKFFCFVCLTVNLTRNNSYF